MAIEVGSKVKTLVYTPCTIYDPYSNDGVNYYNDKYPEGTICTVVYVGQEMAMVKCLGEVSNMFAPLYYFDQLEEIE